MRDEIELLKEAGRMPEGLPPRSSGRPRHRSRRSLRAPASPTAGAVGGVLGLAAPALAAAVAAVVLGITLTGNGSDQAWAAALVRVAEAAPRLLVDEDSWEITRADQFSVDYGEMTLAKDGQELEIKWMPGSEYAQAVGKRDAELDDLGTASAADGEAPVSLLGDDDYVALWLRGDHLVEARDPTPPTLMRRAVLASFARSTSTPGPSAMPESVVKPTSQADVIENMLAGIPLPPGSTGGRSRRPPGRPGSLSAGRTGHGHGGPRVDRPVGGRLAASATRPQLARR